MSGRRRALCVIGFATLVVALARPALAEPNIEVSFEADSDTGAAMIHADARLPEALSTVKCIFTAIAAYPSLHDWIEDAELLEVDGQTEVYMVRFKFPWPVGRHWSRVRVWYEGENSVAWRQIEGSLGANHGQVTFSTRQRHAHVEYRAAIDVGLPEPLTRPYKKKFVEEFLSAVNDRAATLGLRVASRAGQ